MATSHTLEAALDESDNGYLIIHGSYVESNPVGDYTDEKYGQSEQPRLWKYGWFDPYRFYQGKWVIRPQTMLAKDPVVAWSEHHFHGRSREHDERFRIAHLKAITTGWFEPGRLQPALLNHNHFLDPLWAEHLVKAFGNIVSTNRISSAQKQLGAKLTSISHNRFSLVSEGFLKQGLAHFTWNRIGKNSRGEFEFETTDFLPGKPVIFAMRTWPSIDHLECMMVFQDAIDLAEGEKVLASRGVRVLQKWNYPQGLVIRRAQNTPSNRETFVQGTAELVAWILGEC